jgi:hypothetical protein
MGIVLATGSAGFWVLCLMMSVLLIIALEQDSGWWAAILLTIFAALLAFAGDGVAAFKWLLANPIYMAGGFVTYMLVASVWGVAKWAITVRKLARECKEIYQKSRLHFLSVNSAELPPGTEINETTPIPQDLRKKWLSDNSDGDHYNYWLSSGLAKLFKNIKKNNQNKITAPRASDYKSSILLWMALWPLSVIWTVIDDLIKEIFENIYQYISGWLQRISDSAFSGIIEEQGIDSKDSPEK